MDKNIVLMRVKAIDEWCKNCPDLEIDNDQVRFSSHDLDCDIVVNQLRCVNYDRCKLIMDHAQQTSREKNMAIDEEKAIGSV